MCLSARKSHENIELNSPSFEYIIYCNKFNENSKKSFSTTCNIYMHALPSRRIGLNEPVLQMKTTVRLLNS